MLWPPPLQHYEALGWLLLLVPAVVWSWLRAWQGVAFSIAAGLALAGVTYATAAALGHATPDLLPAVLALFAVMAVLIGSFTIRITRAQAAATSERVALLDELTGLPNRRHAELHLEMEIAAAERGRALSVVVFDIDHMQQYNARYGRSAGDSVLKGFASLLRQQTRRMDLAARYGPEEFVAILTGCMEEGAVIFAGRVQERLRAARQSAPIPTVSAGIAVYRPDMLSSRDLLSAAEEALSHAKQDGRDRVRIHGRALEDLREPDSSAVLRAASESLGVTSAARVEASPFAALGSGRDDVGRGRTAFVAVSADAVRSLLLDLLGAEGFQVVDSVLLPDTTLPPQHDFDLVFVDLAAGDPAAGLIREVRLRSPTTRVIGVPGDDTDNVPAELLRIRVDGHYVHTADNTAFREHMRELLAERDALTTVHLRHRHLHAGAPTLDGSAGLEPPRPAAGLRVGEAMFRAMVETSGELTFLLNADATIRYVNPAVHRLLGTHPAACGGQDAFSRLHDDDVVPARVAIEALLDEPGSTRTARVRLRHADGSWRCIDATARSLLLTPGVEGIVITAREDLGTGAKTAAPLGASAPASSQQ